MLGRAVPIHICDDRVLPQRTRGMPRVAVQLGPAGAVEDVEGVLVGVDHLEGAVGVEVEATHRGHPGAILDGRRPRLAAVGLEHLQLQLGRHRHLHLPIAVEVRHGRCARSDGAVVEVDGLEHSAVIVDEDQLPPAHQHHLAAGVAIQVEQGGEEGAGVVRRAPQQAAVGGVGLAHEDDLLHAIFTNLHHGVLGPPVQVKDPRPSRCAALPPVCEPALVQPRVGQMKPEDATAVRPGRQVAGHDLDLGQLWHPSSKHRPAAGR